MNTYKIQDGYIEFSTGYDEKFLRDIRQIPGRKWNAKSKMWVTPITFENNESIISLIKKYGFVKSNDSDDINDSILAFDSIKSAYNDLKLNVIEFFKNPTYKIKPLPFQYDAIAYHLFTKKMLNGSDMGTGKTFMSIYSVEYSNAFPCVVIAPLTILYNWKNKWNQVNPSRNVSVWGDKDFDEKSDVMVINYEIGKKITDEKGRDKIIFKHNFLNEIKPRTLILDEAHKVKNSKTVRSKAIKQLSKGVEYFYELTGTPIMNKPVELINLLTLIDMFTKLFTNYNNFVFRYCNAQYTRFGLDTSGFSNLIELNSILSKNCYFRVELSDVVDDLPDVIENIIQVEIDNRKEYKKAEEDIIEFLREKYDSTVANKAVGAETLVLFNQLQYLSVKGKIGSIVDWIDDFLESSEKKLVVFGIRTDPIKVLANTYNCDYITGEIKAKDRQKIIDDFQVSKKRLLFMNIETGSVGIDGLQNICQDMLLYETPWRWGDVDQAISRLKRIGAKNTITINFLLGLNTIDEYKFELLLNKRLITDQANKGEDTVDFIEGMIKTYLKRL